MLKTVLVLACLAVSVGACSSSDGDDAASGTDPSSTDAADTTDPSSTDAPDTTDAAAEGDDPNNEFCRKFEEFDAPENQPSNQEEMVGAFDELADAAPDSIRGDIETLRDAFSALENLDDADPQDPEALEQVFEILSQPEVEEAGTNLEAYTIDVCGIEPEPAVTASEIETPELSIPDEIDE